MVTNIYAALAAGGASRRATAAFLFASPALNEFAIIFMFLIVGIQGGALYVLLGLTAARLTAYLAPQLGLVPERLSVGPCVPVGFPRARQRVCWYAPFAMRGGSYDACCRWCC